jgi:chaperonin GroES
MELLNPDHKLDIEKIIQSINISDMLEEDELERIGERVIEEYTVDRNSRHEWEERMDAGINLALQVMQKKTFPWIDCANVKFPLLTIAALQFHSRAYPALIMGGLPVDCRVLEPVPEIDLPPKPGPQDPPQKLQAYQQAMAKAQQEVQRHKQEKKRAKRVAHHMSYQILEQDTGWEEEMDRVLLIMAICGCAFKKTYYDPIAGHSVSECVLPRDLVVSYYTDTLERTPRISHILNLFHNDMVERANRGIFNEFEQKDIQPIPTQTESNPANERQGLTPPPTDYDQPYELIEQHRWFDLDGDGYNEPYTVTVRTDNKQVMRIVARFKRKDISIEGKKIVHIEPVKCFTKYPFIPSPDGGFYDLGFGALLGPINDTINTAINQLLDAGTLKTAGGGFLGRGFKARKGDLRFAIGEWKQVDCSGDDLRKSILPMPAADPSTVLFQLLTLLIDFGQQVAGAADIMQGKNPGQNTPAETSRTMVEQGMKVFNGIFKRIHRSFTQELRKLYRLNATFLSESSVFYSRAAKQAVKVFGADYSGDPTAIVPSADPFYMSDSQRMQQAGARLEVAMKVPGYNMYNVCKRFEEAIRTQDIEEVLPNPQGPNAIPPKPDVKLQIEQMKQEGKKTSDELKFKLKQMELNANIQKEQAEIRKIHAEIMKIMAEAKGIPDGHKIAMLEAKIALHKIKVDAYMEMMSMFNEKEEGEKDGSGKQ